MSNTTIRNTLGQLFALAFVLLAPSLRAGTHVWSGGINGYWNVAGNWSSGGVPVVGEANLVVRFPNPSTRQLSTNNIAGLAVQRFEMTGNGHHVYGNGVTLAAAPTGTNFTMGAGIGAFLHLPLTMPAGAYGVHVEINGTLEILSPISGAGGLDKYGRGLLRLNGDSGNTFAGGFRQRQGGVALGKSLGVALPGPVVVGPSISGEPMDMTYEWNHQIADAAAISIRGGDTRLMLEGYDDTVGPIDFVGGAVITYRSGFSSVLGLLHLNGNVTADEATSGFYSEPEIAGRVSLGNAQRTITLPTNRRLILFASVESTGTNGGITLANGNLLLSRSNSFAGPLRIQSGQVYAQSSHAFGSSAGPTILEGGQLFLGYGCFVPAEPLEVREGGYLTVAATNAWNGPIHIHTNQTLNVWSSTFGGYAWLTLGGVISGPGRMTHLIDRVEFVGNQPNTLSGGHFFRGNTFVVLDKSTSNSLTGPITLDYGFNPPAYPTILWNGQHQVSDASRISWPDYAPENTLSGLLDLNGYSEVIGSIQGGPWMLIQCSFGKLTIGADGSDSLYTGSITGTGSGGTNLVKIGSGRLVLGGSHSLAGKTIISGGTMILSNVTSFGRVHVGAGTTLAGAGTLGALTADSSAFVHPGLSLADESFGILRPSSFNLGGGYLRMVLGGTIPGVNCDQVVTSGPLNLNGITLLLSAQSLPHGSNSFTLIDVASGAVSGTFADLPEGAVFPSSDGKSFRITYHGGTGNDVVLTRHYTAPIGGVLTAITPLPGGRMQIGGTGLPFEFYLVLANTNLSTTNWITIGSVSSGDEFGTLDFIDNDAANHPMRFYQFMLP